MKRAQGVLETLRELPPRHFEQFVADVWQERQGWATEVTPKGQDDGLDVIGQPPGGGPKTALQCKRNAAGNKVSAPKIREYASLRTLFGDVSGVTVVTTSSFTRDAERVAAHLDVKLIDGEQLVRIVDREHATDILDWYAAGKPGTPP